MATRDRVHDSLDAAVSVRDLRGGQRLHARRPPPVVGGTAPGPGAAHTIRSYFEAFSPAPAWEELCAWPPDVFALCNLVLDHTEAYRFVVAPPAGERWPPIADWNEQIVTAARQWRDALARPGAPLPALLRDNWAVVTAACDVPLPALRGGGASELRVALVSLHAMADEACAGLSRPVSDAGEFERRAWARLSQTGSLSRISTSRVRITPKTHFASRGITIRSMSRYLALCYEAVDVDWHRLDADLPFMPASARGTSSVLLIPWPLRVASDDFHPVDCALDNMDVDAFGFFEFAPEEPLDLGKLDRVLTRARRQVLTVDTVVLPESAVDASEVPALEQLLAEHQVSFLVVGVRAAAVAGRFGRNYVHRAVYTTQGWQQFEQPKHHRWCLDGPQLRQYHLSRVLDPRKQWWEAIELPPRMVQIIDVGGVVTAALVCEDLARMDEVTDLLRRIGPLVVTTILLDGPQLASRWSCRYAAVLGDEPGSAVLTLTSLGMALRSTPPGFARSRVVALWNSPASGIHEIALDRGASAILVTGSVDPTTVWTADGRKHALRTPQLTLRSVLQL